MVDWLWARYLRGWLAVGTVLTWLTGYGHGTEVVERQTSLLTSVDHVNAGNGLKATLGFVVVLFVFR